MRYCAGRLVTNRRRGGGAFTKEDYRKFRKCVIVFRSDGILNNYRKLLAAGSVEFKEDGNQLRPIFAEIANILLQKNMLTTEEAAKYLISGKYISSINDWSSTYVECA